MRERFRLEAAASEIVRVEPDGPDNEVVSVRLGPEESGVEIVGSRFDVHQLIIEADRQLGQLTNRFTERQL